MIHALDNFPTNVVAFLCTGRVTKGDYDTTVTPTVAAVLELHREIRLYYQTTADFSIDADAAWEDFKVGVEHLTRWERIAVVTDVNWLRRAVRAFSFLLPGRVKVFPATETAAARQWITDSPANYTSSAA